MGILMRALLEAAAAIARHPQEAAQILTKVGASNPSEIDWAYEACTRIGGEHVLGHELKGINRFIYNAENQGLALEGRLVSNPKKRLSVDLDPVALAQDPTRCPHEIWGGMPKPSGYSLWFWRPRQVASPGWNEAVIIDGITDGKITLLRLYADTSNEGYPLLLEKAKDAPTWSENHPDASGRVDTFGRSLLATIGEYSRTGKLVGVSPASTKALAVSKLRALTPDEIVKIHASFQGGYVVGPDAAAKLLSEIHRMGFTDQSSCTSIPEKENQSLWGKRIAQGRHFKWGESIALEELSDYARLRRNTGVSSGNAMDVFASLADPVCQDNHRLADSIIANLAMGEGREQALMSAQAQLASRPAPSPTARWGF
jgi:hypothetical protein